MKAELQLIKNKISQLSAAPTLGQKGQIAGEVIGLIGLLVGTLLMIYIAVAMQSSTNYQTNATFNLVRDTFLPLVVLVAAAAVILGAVLSIRNGGGA